MEDKGLVEICEGMDEVLIELMASLKELSCLRNKYRDVIKEGYLGLSLARHAMGGPSHVSSLQYDSCMKSLVQVHVEKGRSTEIAESSLSNGDPLQTILDKSTHVELKLERYKSGEMEVESRSKPTELRRRKGESVEDVPTWTSEQASANLKDPLKWFGILVPRDLRQAQQYFIQVIEHSVELAEAQTRFVMAHEKYQQLLSKKREFPNHK